MCEFTLDLRRRNATKSVPNESVMSIPTLSIRENHNFVQSIRSALGRLHENIIEEMGERNDSLDIADSGSREPEQDDLQEGLNGVNLEKYAYKFIIPG
ncbi:hypothetical protein Clacol_007813 [Clathrus columnatus]|uniref:Uncharacterized protein n=1 Tax=Clathrus columnatus TaxID=1419009 RepID=A0AAV5ALJ8_9AGAM|nr:hypothetical protein Clacol_007813 [Clathrus columnatus]